MLSSRRLGTCSHCHRPHCAVKRGKVRMHGETLGALGIACPGVGKPPLRSPQPPTLVGMLIAAAIGGGLSYGIVWLVHHFLG